MFQLILTTHMEIWVYITFQNMYFKISRKNFYVRSPVILHSLPGTIFFEYHLSNYLSRLLIYVIDWNYNN